MIRCFLPFAVLFFCAAASAQQPYWQQRADHVIRVSLDDRSHVLRGEQTISYTNNSPDTLRFIYIELYMSGFSSKKTFYAKEKLRKGDWDFQKSDAVDMGRVDSLSFTANNQPLSFELDKMNSDYGKLMLTKPLEPGEKIELQNTFRVKLPKTFSRGGHDGQSYQVTQWFPKPAVYDKSGWHPLPYSEQGEFYAEYGSYDVSITLPANYLVGATGNLQTEKEKQWLNELANKYKSSLDKSNAPTNPFSDGKTMELIYRGFPPTETNVKTLRYTADNVQDFAWFADKRFYVLKSEVTLPISRRKVETWAFFHSEKRKMLWQQATTYIDSAVYFYSKWVGDYAHDQATAVEGALIAGAGMEYPNVMVIGDMNNASSLEQVITHEVGHNWFQGMLGSNERANPWMDEGLNSYYENRVINRQPKTDTNLPRGLNKLIGLDKVTPAYTQQLAFLYQARRNEEQPICLHANEFSTLNLGTMVYLKTPVVFNYLEHHIGSDELDKLFQQYFNEYKFKHSQPEDFQRVLNSSGLELDWLWNDALCSTKRLDYKITSIDTTVIAGSSFYKIGVKNKGGVKGPLNISSLSENETQTNTKRYGGFLGKNELLFPYSSSTKALRIDAEETMYEYNRHNNTIRTRGLFKKCEPLKLQFLTSIEKPYRNVINVLPAVGYNMYDGFQVGLALHNLRIPPSDFEWALVPIYATQRSAPTGIARVQGYMFPKNFRHIRLTALVSSFAYDESNSTLSQDSYSTFYKAHGGVQWRLKTPNLDEHALLDLKYYYISQRVANHYPGFEHVTVYDRDYHVFSLGYSFANKRNRNPWSVDFELPVYNDNKTFGLRLTAETNYRISYSKRKGLDLRLFGGVAPDAVLPLNLGATPGYDDFTFSHYFVGRSEREGLASQQVLLNQGGLKYRTAFYNGFDDGFGEHAEGILALNVKTSLPIPIVFLFADAGMYLPKSYNSVGTTGFQYDAGIGLRVIPDVLEIYLPLLFSEEVKLNLHSIPAYNNWYERVVFTLQLENLDPFKLIRSVKLN